MYKNNERRDLWDILESVCGQNVPVIIIDDYNVIVVKREKNDGKFVVNCKV